MNRDVSRFENLLIEEMKGEFGDDQVRVDHALQVLEFAREIHGSEGGDPLTVVAAAVLHDIGIQEAERKHGSSSGRYQELEGPPIAKKIMEGLDLGGETIEHVCRIVGNHHSARDIDTLEFRILWDADWLVNIPYMYGDYDKERLRRLVGRVFKTDAGRDKARKIFLEE